MKSKKWINYVFFITIMMVIGVNVVFAATNGTAGVFPFCSTYTGYDGAARVFMILGYVLVILKIMVPIVLIGVGILKMGESIISDKVEETLKKNAIDLAKRIGLGVLIFFIPSISNFIFSLVYEALGTDSNITTNYYTCTKCLTDPSNCGLGGLIINQGNANGSGS